VARSAIARDAVGALDVGGAASDTAQRPLDQCDCFDRLRPPSAEPASVANTATRLVRGPLTCSADHGWEDKSSPGDRQTCRFGQCRHWSGQPPPGRRLPPWAVAPTQRDQHARAYAAGQLGPGFAFGVALLAGLVARQVSGHARGSVHRARVVRATWRAEGAQHPADRCPGRSPTVRPLVLATHLRRWPERRGSTPRAHACQVRVESNVVRNHVDGCRCGHL